MAAKRNKTFLIAGCLVVLVIIASIIRASLFDINDYKLRIETAASEGIGLDVRVNDKMRLSYFPLSLSANDVHVANKGIEIFSLRKAKIGVKLIPLLKRQLKFSSCEIEEPTITIVKDAERKYNFENSEKKLTKENTGTGFSLKELKLFHGTLVYLDKKSGEKTELKEINLAIKDLSIGNAAKGVIKNMSFTGNMYCKAVQIRNLKLDNVKSTIKVEKGVIYFIPVAMDIFDGKGEGEITAQMTEVDISYKINLKVSRLDFATLVQSLGAKKMIGGKGDLHAALMVKGDGSPNLMRSMDGVFSVRGNNLVTYTMDLDKVLSSYETSQQFSLVDLGAFFIAGPISTIGLKGYRYRDVYKQTRGDQGQGEIKQLISRWKIKNGKAAAVDCALATRHNRVALKGRLDLVSQRYDNVTVAILDDKGCATFKQEISGSISSPKVGAVSVIESLGGPISNLYRKTKRFVQSGKCEVFYKGSVRHP